MKQTSDNKWSYAPHEPVFHADCSECEPRIFNTIHEYKYTIVQIPELPAVSGLFSVVCDRRVLKSPGISMLSGCYGLRGELTRVNGFMIMIAKVPWVIPDNNLRFLVQSQPVSKKWQLLHRTDVRVIITFSRDRLITSLYMVNL